jgi:two-component sensor histidine kinase
VRDAVSVPLSYALSSPLVARTRAVEFVSPWASNEFRMELSLLVTELVTNAVLHGLPDVHLHVCAVGAVRLRVEVFDGSFALPEMRDSPMESTSGRGLRLVDAIAVEWGARPQLNGKVVWCELADRGT